MGGCLLLLWIFLALQGKKVTLFATPLADAFLKASFAHEAFFFLSFPFTQLFFIFFFFLVYLVDPTWLE
jgi:hypothetical protein